MRVNLKLKRNFIGFDGNRDKFGKYLGKMDIISSLATLSYDKRRVNFYKRIDYTIELVDKNIIDKNILYGS